MLEAGIYGSEFSNTYGPFGLRCGQMRGGVNSISHNGGWYNQRGEKLGFGDLDISDLENICGAIPANEAFIVLSEHDSFWNFVNKIGVIGALCDTDPMEADPGIDYVLEHARYIVLQDWVSKAGSEGWSRAIAQVVALNQCISGKGGRYE